MNNLKITIITFFAFIAIATACCKKTPDCGSLPCPTTSGANVVSCLINGTPFIVKGNNPTSSMFSCTSGTKLKNKSLGIGYTIDISNCKDKSEEYKVLRFDVGGVLAKQKYSISELSSTNCRIQFIGLLFNIFSDKTTIGELSITHLDSKVVSGTFNFVITDPNTNKKYTCTNGNFDLSL
jgi:hypothetical protein